MSNARDNTLHVEVLGPLRVRVGDLELPLGPSRQRAVFAVLAANANRVVTRGEIVDAVWGDFAPASASGSVHTYISGLRRSIEPDRSRWSTPDVLLASVAGGYQLRLPENALDAANFARLRTEAQRHVAGGDRAAAVAALDNALGLWAGEAYGGVPGPFAELERQRLTELRLATIEQRSRLVLELGGHAEIVPELTALVRDHPLQENLHELLMLALYHGGRPAEALEAYTSARRVLIAELGVEPGSALRRLHAQILAGEVEPARAPSVPAHAGQQLSVVPAPVARAWSEAPGRHPYVGRAAELALLDELVADLAAGRGRSVWIDGEAGIGKSQLLTVALAGAGAAGCQLAWSVADELGQRVALQVVTEALGLDIASNNPRLAALAEQLHGDADDVGPALAAERLVAFVREVCAAGPLILVIDDMQWADDTSLLVWGRLAAATRRLPLLLVAASRPEPNRPELAHLRRGVRARDGYVLELGPLSSPDVEYLIGQIVGARPGANLRALAPRTAGNPLYAWEMASALVRQKAVQVADGVAEIDVAAADEAPQSLLAAVRRTLEFLSPDTVEVLRLTSLLGMEFAVAEVVALTGRSPVELVRTFEEAVGANVVVDAGAQLAFRHPFLYQAVYDSIPRALRATLRRHAAEVLATSGSPVTRVTEQLAAEPVVVDPWVVGWLTEHLAEIVKRAPLLAVDLFRQALETDVPTGAQHERLLVALVKLGFRLDLYPETEARHALTIAKDPAVKAEMRQLLAAMRFKKDDAVTAISLLSDAAHDPGVPEVWRARHRVLLAQLRRGDLSDLERAERAARQVYAEATAAGQPFEAAFALQTLWLLDSIRRDHDRALAHLDEALALVRDDASLASLHYDLLDNRVFSLQNLDRLGEAQETLVSAAEVVVRHELPACLQVAAAVQYYWVGRWDEALAEVASVTVDGAPWVTFQGMREPNAVAILLHGVGALIAARRGDLAAATAHLDAADAQLPGDRGPIGSADRESRDFVLVAKALVAEQHGHVDEALSILAPLRQPSYAPMMLRHQWLPDTVRMALSAGASQVAEVAAAVCAEEAARETVPARAFAAAARCRALLAGEPEPALEAARHYRDVGRRPELAAALEDAAVLLAKAGRTAEATAAYEEAKGVLRALAANDDLARARERLRGYGLERASRVVATADLFGVR